MQPIYTAAAAPGNLLADTVLGPGASVAALLVQESVVYTEVVLEVSYGATAPAAVAPPPVILSLRPAYGTAAALSLAAAAPAGSTSITLAGSAAGLNAGQQIALLHGGVGEIVTTTAAPTTDPDPVVACDALVGSYAAGDPVYLISRAATAVAAPGPSDGSIPLASTDYSSEVEVGTGTWILVAANTDTAATATVSATASTLDGVTF